MTGDARRAALGRARLYLCTADRPDLAEFVTAVCRAGVDIVQLRDKTLPDRALLERAAVAREAAHAAGALFVLNDRPDLAVACEADGVHVGQDDVPAAVAGRSSAPTPSSGSRPTPRRNWPPRPANPSTTSAPGLSNRPRRSPAAPAPASTTSAWPPRAPPTRSSSPAGSPPPPCPPSPPPAPPASWSSGPSPKPPTPPPSPPNSAASWTETATGCSSVRKTGMKRNRLHLGTA